MLASDVHREIGVDLAGGVRHVVAVGEVVIVGEVGLVDGVVVGVVRSRGFVGGAKVVIVSVHPSTINDSPVSSSCEDGRYDGQRARATAREYLS